MTSYYAVKHMLYPAGGDEETSIFSDCASSICRFSPRKPHGKAGGPVGARTNSLNLKSTDHEAAAAVGASKSISPSNGRRRNSSNYSNNYIRHRMSVNSTRFSREERQSRTGTKM